MSLHSSWRPAEDKMTMLKERTWLAGMILAAVAYGIVFTLFVLTFKQLIGTTTKNNYSQRLLFIIYITVMFILGTLYVGSIAKMTEVTFIDYSLYPGGLAVFEELKVFSVVEISNASWIISNWMADGMMIYRYLVIFRSTRRFPFWVVISMPLFGYLTSLSLGVLWLTQISTPLEPWNTFDGAINFITPYCLVSLFLHISITIAICARLLIYRRRIASVLGPNHGTHYTSLVAMLVESASLSSVFILLFFIPFALDNPIQNVFFRLLAEVQILATLLIIYRVAYGAAWASETSRTILCPQKTQTFAGVRVQVESSGFQRDERPLNSPSKLDGGQGEEYEL